jgi:hypothetical protein
LLASGGRGGIQTRESRVLCLCAERLIGRFEWCWFGRRWRGWFGQSRPGACPIDLLRQFECLWAVQKVVGFTHLGCLDNRAKVAPRHGVLRRCFVPNPIFLKSVSALLLQRLWCVERRMESAKQGMTTGEVRAKLRERGIPVSQRQVQLAVENGKIDRPRQDLRGNFRWTEADVDKLFEIFK